jgi:hypothetical protein
MQYITVTAKTGAVVRISLGAVESWEPGSTGAGGKDSGSLLRYGGQTLIVREAPDQIDAQISQFLTRS